MDRLDDVLKFIQDDFPRHISFVYEKIAFTLLLKNSEAFFPMMKLGRWWSKTQEIDMVGCNSELDAIVFGEVKWTSKLVGTNVYEALKIKSSQVVWGSKNRKEYFCLFSKQGFTDAMIEMARKENIRLFQGETLMRI